MSGRVRAALGLATWLVASFAALLIAGAAVRATRLGTVSGYGILVAALVLVSFAVWAIVDRRPARSTPLALDRRSASAFGRGAVLGALLVGIVVAILAVAGAYEIAPRSCRAEPLARFVAWSVAFVLLASLFEEALFRGYALFALRELVGGVVAVAVTGLLFALGHRTNPGFGPWAILNLAIVGGVLAVWVLRERSVWVAVGAHAGWNAAIVAAAAIPVSGLAFPAPCHAGIVAGPDWLTGGTFGIEAGIPTTAVWVAFATWLVFAGRRARAERRPTFGD